MLAAEASRDDPLSAGYDHKVRSGSTALAALRLEDAHDSAAGSPPGSISPATLSPPSGPERAPSLPMDISRTSSSNILLRQGSSGRLSFLSCFSSSGLNTLGDEETPPSACSCEVGIRPSFYWVDAPTSEEQRAEAEGAMRFLKADCQDEATVIQNFGGIPGLTFAGVFDGHGPHGRAAAKFASDRLPAALAAQVPALHSRSERKRLKAMREACRVVDTAMQLGREGGFDASLSGTTACFALVMPTPRGTRVLLANVGDSRCVLGRRRSDGDIEAIALTVDAKPSLPTESRRIVQCGGIVQQLLDENGERRGAHRVFRRGDDVLPGLAMSRSLGDAYAHSVGVTWEPMLSSHTMSEKDLFLVLGTDGLWDVMNGDAAVDFVERYRLQRDPGMSCAEALTLEAQERWKAAHDEALVDDISVAILHFVPMPPPEPRPSRSLPRTMSRAASSNDEANALASTWLKASEANPSHRSPRPLFQYLYRTGEVAGSGDFWDSLPKEAPGSPFRVAAAQAEESRSLSPPASPKRLVPPPAAAVAPSPAAPVAPSPAAPLPLTTVRSIRTTRGVAIPGPLATPPEDLELLDAPEEHVVHGGHSLRSVPHPAMLPVPQPRGGVQGMPIPSSSLSISAYPSRPIPMNHTLASSAPAVPSILGGADQLRPIRKAYPSAATMASVPSWDGAFFNSFVSDLSLPLMATSADTPRSSESDPSTRPRRVEGRHEGKVRRGVPQSFSSIGLASCGRNSTDSEVSLGTSRVGSLEESCTLSIAAAIPVSANATLVSPGKRGLPRPSSHGSLMGLGGNLSHGNSNGRQMSGRAVTIVRPIYENSPVSAGI